MSTDKLLCIYHGNCADGFTAAWVVWKAVENVEFIPGIYGEDPPDVTGRDVLIVDYSYKLPVLTEMSKKAEHITILDHHKSAQADLENHNLSNVDITFDMTRSGAKITWDYFYPRSDPPRLLLHVQDRDLWQFKLPGTREIQAALFSYPYDFDMWNSLMRSDVQELIEDGTAIERKHFKDIDELLKVCTRRMLIGGYDVPVANLPYTMSSDAGHQLAQGEPFAACYYDGPTGRNFSLRSTDEGLDVSAIAVQYGGGGHKHAAGFKLPYDVLSRFDIRQND